MNSNNTSPIARTDGGMNNDSPTISANLIRPNLSTDGMTTTMQVVIDKPTTNAVDYREVILCIDVSWSMQGDKLESAKLAASQAAALLDEGDKLGVVTFSSEAQVDIPVSTINTNQVEEIQAKINQFEVRGGTNIAGGLKQAYNQFSDNSNAAQWLLFLSDGQDNALTTEEFGDLAAEIAYDGITIQPAGIGDAEREIIEVLAERGTGQWAEMEGPDDIIEFFSDQIERSRRVAETNTQLQFTMPNGGRVGEIKESDPQIKSLQAEKMDDDTYVLPLSDMEAGRRQSIMIEVVVPEHSSADNVPIVDLHLSTNAREENVQVTANFTSDPERIREQNDSVVAQKIMNDTMTMIAEENPDSMDEVSDAIEQATNMIPGDATNVTTTLEEGATTIIDEGRKGIEKATKMDTTIIGVDDEDDIEEE